MENTKGGYRQVFERNKEQVAMGTRVFYKDENSAILQGDMLTDEKIPENHIDLIVTSPSYDANKRQ